MSEYVPARLRQLVRLRASGRCEYCLSHEEDCLLPHEPDHIIAVKHGGKTEEQNMAWTCFVCNRAKGSDIASIDISTGKIERLFNPRVDKWDQHFSLADQGTINPLSAIGRVTVSLLNLNRPELVEIRKALGPGWSRKPR